MVGGEDLNQKNSKINTTLLKRNFINNWLDEVIQESVPIEKVEKVLQQLDMEMGSVLLSVLIKKLEDPDVRVRSMACWALGYLGDESAIGPLRKLLYDPNKSDVAKAAAISGLQELGEYVDPTSIPLKNPKAMVKNLMDQFIAMLEEEVSRDMLFEEFLGFPDEIQIWLVEEFSKIDDPKVIRFLYAISMDEEIDQKVKQMAKNYIENLEMKGKRLSEELGEFYKAWVSKTRGEGGVSLFVSWVKETGSLIVLLFTLDFTIGEISEFSVIYDMSKNNFNTELIQSTSKGGHKRGMEFAETNYNEVIALLKLAWEEGIKEIPLEFRRYRYLLEEDTNLSDSEWEDLIYRLIPDSDEPESVVGAYYSAIINMDDKIIYDLLSVEKESRIGLSREEYVDSCIENDSDDIYYAFSINETQNHGKESNCYVYALVEEDGQFMEKEELITLYLQDGKWKVSEHEVLTIINLDYDRAMEILDRKQETQPVIARATYRVNNNEIVLSKLKKSENIRIIEEGNGYIQFELLINQDAEDDIPRFMPVVIGIGTIEADELFILSWGQEDLDKVVVLIEKLLGDGISMIGVEPFVMYKDVENKIPEEAGENSIEDELMNEWLYQPVDALKGQTLYDAAKDPENREVLEELLNSAIAAQKSLSNKGFNLVIDYRKLRKRLGL